MDLRKLDALVAEHVMGWGKNVSLGYGDIFYPPGPPEMNIIGHIVPSYSTDIAAAWQVVEKLKSASSSYFNLTNAPKGWTATVDLVRQVQANGETAPLAICLAVLRAIGIDVSEWEK